MAFTKFSKNTLLCRFLVTVGFIVCILLYLKIYPLLFLANWYGALRYIYVDKEGKLFLNVYRRIGWEYFYSEDENGVPEHLIPLTISDDHIDDHSQGYEITLQPEMLPKGTTELSVAIKNTNGYITNGVVNPDLYLSYGYTFQRKILGKWYVIDAGQIAGLTLPPTIPSGGSYQRTIPTEFRRYGLKERTMELLPTGKYRLILSFYEHIEGEAEDSLAFRIAREFTVK